MVSLEKERKLLTREERFNVPTSVVENVKKYFKESNSLQAYTAVKVLRSNNLSDEYCYHVIAVRIDEQGKEVYACWTSWNETTQCLNHGHYCLESEEEAMEVLDEFYTHYKARKDEE